MNLERRIANAVKRVHEHIEFSARNALWHVGQDALRARSDMHEQFTTAARSLGQSRRYRNRSSE